MTDKQIIIDGIDVSECKYFSKYQKIVRNNECIVDIQNACVEEIETKPCWQKHNCYFKDWQRKEQECEELKEEIINRNKKIEQLRFSVSDLTNRLCGLNAEKSFRIVDLEQTLAEIKPILEYYEDSKIGKKQEDGSYKLEFTFSDIATPYCINYDPKPAREALRKINECEITNE